MSARIVVAGVLGALVLGPIVSVAQEVSVTDQRGKLVELAAPAERVIVLPKPAPALVIAVDGGTDHLIGLHPAAQAVLMAGPLGKRYPEIAEMNTSIVGDGFVPNVEAMLAEDPDVVIQWASKPDQRIDPMERVGIPVVGFGWGSYEIEAEQIEIVGKLLGQEERAKGLLGWHGRVRDEIARVVDPIPQEERTTMVFVDQFDALTVFGRNEHFFQVPGLRNLAFEAGIDQGTATIDAEQLLAMDPDIIFLNYYDLAADPAKVYADPRFADLKAVKNHRVYVTPRLDPGSHESPLVWSWMAALAYPDKVDADLRAEIAAQMKTMYDIDLSDDDIDSVLQYGANEEGAHYAELFGR